MTSVTVRVPSGRRGIERAVWRIIAAVAALGVWQLAALYFGGNAVPSPAAVLAAFVELVPTATFWSATWATVACALIGVIITMLIAIPAGLAVGSSRFAVTSSRFTVDFMRTIPPIALMPLALLLWGPSWTMQIMLVVFGSVWPLFVQANYAVQELDPVVRDVTRTSKLPFIVRWSAVTLPSSAPFLITGVRVAATVALLLAVAAEFIGGAPGVGQQIGQAQVAAQPAKAYAYVIVAALLGVAINLATAVIGRTLLHWHPSVRGERS